MSITAARDFRRHVNRMPTLQREVAEYVRNGAVDYAGLALLGCRSGFDFTPDEARRALSTADAELAGFEGTLATGGILVPT